MKISTDKRAVAESITAEAEVHEYHLGVLDNFAEHLAEKGLSANSVRDLRGHAGQFFLYLRKRHIDINHITTSDIARYWLACGERLSSSSMHKTRYVLRLLLGYLPVVGILEHDLSHTLPPAHRGRTTRIKRYFSDDEVSAVLTVIDCSTVKGKRDYAMLMLAATTALRGGDIVKLKIVDIDWSRSQISLVQHKNKRLHTVPLLPCAGNAVLDYILNGRPCLNNPFLFLSCRAPNHELKTSSSCKAIMKKRLDEAGIDMAGRAVGLHGFRVHAASKLLEEGVPLSTISSFLGHRSPLSIKPYLSVDVAGMRSCCLSLKGIEVRGLR